MKKISTNNTIILRRGLPLILLLFFIGLIFIVIFSTHTLKDFVPPLLGIVWLAIGWAVYFRNLEEVYADKNGFVIRGQKILFEDVISMKKEPVSIRFRVRYYQQDKIKSFRFSASSFLFMKPGYIKEIERRIERNN